MKYLIAAILATLLYASAVYSEEILANTTEPSGDRTQKYCPGNWSLLKSGTWAVRNKSGTIMPISASTVILGCDGSEVRLEDELAGASADITCAEPIVPNGLPTLKSVRIICE